MGPLGPLVATNPRTADLPLLTPTGGKSRTKVPKPWQKSVEMIDH